MFRPQMRRRRRALDTYIHVDLEERGSLTENDPSPYGRIQPTPHVRRALAARSPMRAPSELSA